MLKNLYLPAIFLFCLNLESEVFSPFNKFELSYQNQESIYDSIIVANQRIFYSQPLKEIHSLPAYFLGLKYKDQKIEINGNVINVFKIYNKKPFDFVAIGSDILYKSKYLEAFIRFKVYTLDGIDKNEFSEIEFERFYSQTESPIEGFFNFDFNMPFGYLALKFKNLELSSGRKKLRWGPGYKGTLGLSGTTFSPFYIYHISLNFAKRLQMTCYLSGLDDDKAYEKELLELKKDSSFTGEIDNNSARYNAGQRFDFIINDHFQFGFFELCDFFGQKDLIRYANPLQIYYFGENSGSGSVNLLGGFDFNILFRPVRIYAELINDDVTFFDKIGNPNKYAFQLGTVYYGKKYLLEAGFEYTHVSPYVYGNTHIKSRHAFWGESLGWPYGNDQDLFHFHSIFNLHEKVKAKYEFNFWLKGDGEIEDDWYADGMPDLDHAPYWPVNEDKIITMIFNVEHKPFYWLTTSLYCRPIIKNKKYSNDIHLYIFADIPGKKAIDLEKRKMK